MLIDQLVKKQMYIQNLSFENRVDETVITRTVAYSSSITQQEVCQYFLKSISRDFNLKMGSVEACVCYFEPQELTKRINYRIDQYWIDGEVHLMMNEDKNEEVLVILSTSLEDSNIFECLQDETHLVYVNTLEECWIKRQGCEYTLTTR